MNQLTASNIIYKGAKDYIMIKSYIRLQPTN